MSRSVLGKAPFEQHTLTYMSATDEWGEDHNGNPIPIEVPRTVVALLSPFKVTQLQRLPGADAVLATVRGELIEPLTFSAEVRVGTPLTIEWEGRTQKLVLTNVIPNDLPRVKFGTYFEGELT